MESEFPSYIQKALAIYNAPQYPYNTPKDVAAINIGTGKGKVHKRIAHHKVGRGKICKTKKGKGHMRRKRK